MNKKITSVVLAVLMIAGTTSFSAFAAMSNGTVVIGSKAFDLDYANNPANMKEITSAIVKGGTIYVKDFEGKWINNITGLEVSANVIPAVVYKNADKEINYDAADKDAVNILADAINITSVGNTTSVVNGGTLQISAAITPVNATNKAIIWSVTAGTGTATIDTTGLLKATGVGTVTVKATNIDSGVTKTMAITVIANVSTASELTAALANNSISTITFTASFSASPNVTRPVTMNFGAYNLTGNISFNYTGRGTSVLTGNAGNRIIGDLTVDTANASFKNGVKVSGAVNVVNVEIGTWTESADGNVLIITDNNGASMTVTGHPGSVTVSGDASGSLTLNVNAGATVTNIISNALIDIVVATGATVNNITAAAGSTGSTITNNGTTGTVTANVLTNIIIGTGATVTNITTAAGSGGSTITNNGMTGTVTANAPTDITVSEGATVTNITAAAGSTGTTITNNGTTGTVTANVPINLIANVAPTNSITGESGSIEVTGTQSNSVAKVEVNAITVLGADNETTVVNGGALQMSSAVAPLDATNKSIVWSVTPGTGTATIDTTGLLKATGVGTVTVIASNDASGVIGTKEIVVGVAPNANQTAPTELLVGEAPTSALNDGKITGTTTAMEYKLSTDEKYTVATGAEITKLVAGNYEVRYAAKDGFNAGAIKSITVSAYVAPVVDKTALETATMAMTSKVEENFTALSWSIFTMANATNVLMPEITQAQVDAKVVAINTAIAGLVENDKQVATVSGASLSVSEQYGLSLNFKIDEEINLDQRANVTISYFTKNGEIETPISNTLDGGAPLVKDKTWGGYLWSGTEATPVKYSRGSDSPLLSNTIPAGTNLYTLVKKGFASDGSMNYTAITDWKQPATYVAKIEVTDNDGNVSTLKTVNFTVER